MELVTWRLKRPVKAVRTMIVRLTTVLLYVQAATRNGYPASGELTPRKTHNGVRTFLREAMPRPTAIESPAFGAGDVTD